ncbi:MULTISPECIES: ABC transporter permease subunit [unclassified Acidisoma]|jgi:putrescine transport system permease protein|uniref:ABC transporter permease subunit n=1 Tax=unclassified Acidisoma TaxID=2634065 RepID=UPI00131E5BC6|nr:MULTISPECIES: ABC transporter permease subunit [unclassified Acidisoma]
MRKLGVARLVFGVGVAFLYIPIITLIIFSFNSSRIVMLWGGFSTKWYASLFHNGFMMAAARRTLEIGLTAATCAVVLGTMAGYSLARFGPFRGRTLFSGMITAPLVMPDVITGISLLLMFIAMGQLIGWPADRGMLTIAIAHITFCTSYVTVVLQSRLVALDRSLEEAAMDLGCRPLRILFDITLPIIAPALLSAWLLAFTLSLDDLVISSFVAGPGSTTLPLLIFSEVKLDVKPDVNALAAIVIAFVTIGTIIAGFVMASRERKRLRDEQLAFAAEAAARA